MTTEEHDNRNRFEFSNAIVDTRDPFEGAKVVLSKHPLHEDILMKMEAVRGSVQWGINLSLFSLLAHQLYYDQQEEEGDSL